MPVPSRGPTVCVAEIKQHPSNIPGTRYVFRYKKPPRQVAKQCNQAVKEQQARAAQAKYYRHQQNTTQHKRISALDDRGIATVTVIRAHTAVRYQLFRVSHIYGRQATFAQWPGLLGRAPLSKRRPQEGSPLKKGPKREH